MKAIAADIDNNNFNVWLDTLDIDRSVRIYKSLADLSTKAVKALQESQSQKFSEITDIMRPLIGYVTDNKVKLSRFLDHGAGANAVRDLIVLVLWAVVGFA